MSNGASCIDCKECPRLVNFLDRVREKHPDYHARPVPSFGDDVARLLIVGLAPGMHGANATGRPFTGDYAGILLYQTLFDLGMASHPIATTANDGLVLKGCRITNAVKCLPPENKPTTDELYEILTKGSGTEFDPKVVDAFLSAFQRGEMEVPPVLV